MGGLPRRRTRIHKDRRNKHLKEIHDKEIGAGESHDSGVLAPFVHVKHEHSGTGLPSAPCPVDQALAKGAVRLKADLMKESPVRDLLIGGLGLE